MVTQAQAPTPVQDTALHTAESVDFQSLLPIVASGSADAGQGFAGLDTACEHLSLQRGEALYRAGDPADGLYILVSGRLRLEYALQHSGEAVEVTAGAIVGASGALGEVTRDHGAFALRDCRLLYLSRAAFERMSVQHPRAAVQLTRSVVLQGERPARGHAAAARGRALVVVPLGPEVPVRAFTRRLRNELANSGKALHLHAERLDEILGPGASSSLEAAVESRRAAAWLNMQEEHHDLVLYEADAAYTPWTMRCLRQADHLLFVGCADSNPALSRLEIVLNGQPPDNAVVRRSLVLVQPENRAEPVGTAAWIAVRRLDDHFHLWLDRRADIERLARHLSGRAVGLILGSGGARGFTHLGVLRALVEARIPVDLVGGVSVGALIAAQAALGASPEEMLERGRELAASARSLLRFTMPLVSVFSAAKLSGMLDNQFGDRQIEDLRIPFFCATSNLHANRLMVHRNGRLAHYLRASCSAPGLLPPVLDDGDLLVDGAVLNAVPVYATRALCQGGPVIAVDVSAEITLQRDYRFADTVTGRQALWSRINPFARGTVRAPGLISVLMRSAELSSVHYGDTEVRSADVYIQPPVSAYRMFDMRHFDELVEHGYRSTLAALDSWQRGERRGTLKEHRSVGVAGYPGFL